MPEIGATLREARMRQRIDISEIEAQTKIRAKYLRALENEEWDLLPGPDVRQELPAHLRARRSGSTSRLLLEEYKLRHERLVGARAAADRAAGRARARAGRSGPRGRSARDVARRACWSSRSSALLIVLGRSGDDDDSAHDARRRDAARRTTQHDAATQASRPGRPAAPTRVARCG